MTKKFLFVALFLLAFGGASVYAAVSGDLLWTQTYSTSEAMEMGEYIVTDAQGNVYVTGTQLSFSDSGGFSIRTTKYDGEGNLQWTDLYSTGSQDLDMPSAIALGASGDVYVTGMADDDAITLKYGPTGTLKWAKRFDSSTHTWDEAYDLAIGPGDAVYIVGQTGGTEESEAAANFLVVKYSAWGTRQWTRVYKGPAGGQDSATAVDVSPTGAVYVTGTSWGGAKKRDFAIVKFDSAGNQRWVKRYNGASNGHDDPVDIAVSASNDVFVTGSSYSGTSGYDYVTLRYNYAGTRMWGDRYTSYGAGRDEPVALALWRTNNLYVTGISRGDGLTLRYTRYGKRVWAKRDSTKTTNDDEVSGLAVDTTGDVVTTGYGITSGTTGNFRTIMYRPDGSIRWTRTYDGSAGKDDGAFDVAIDQTGDVYVTGLVSGTTIFDGSMATLKYSH